MKKDKKLPTGNGITYCQTCDADTLSILHGYDEKGKLWKGHVCECRNWICSVCGKITVGKKSNECCR